MKIRLRITVLFKYNNTRVGPILQNIFRCSVNFIKLQNAKIGYDIRKEFIQNLGSFFITLYNLINLNNSYFFIQDNFVLIMP